MTPSKSLFGLVFLLNYLGRLTASGKSEAPTVDKQGLVEKTTPKSISRFRRQSPPFHVPSSTETITGSSADLNSTITIQTDFERDFYITNEFLECIKDEYGSAVEGDPDYDTCVVSFAAWFGNESLGSVIRECGVDFYISLENVVFSCSCTRYDMRCTFSKKMPRGQNKRCSPLSNRILCWLRRFTLVPDCDGTTELSSTSSSSLTTSTSTSTSTSPPSTSPSSSVQVTVESGTTSPNAYRTPSTSLPARLSDMRSNVRLVGGVIGGVAVGVVITSVVVLICCVCRDHIGKKYAVETNSTSTKPKDDDRKALCEQPNTPPNSGRNYHVYELPDVVGRLPSYATCAEVTTPKVNPSDIEYNHLGDHNKETTGTGHVYDFLDKSKATSRQQVINNDYNHTWIEGETTVNDNSSSEYLSAVDVVCSTEEPPYSTIKESSEKGNNPKYFILEKLDNEPSSPPYQTISVTNKRF